MDTTRRSLLVGLGCIIAAPAIVRASSLMKVKVIADHGDLSAMAARWIAGIEADKADRAVWARMNAERIREMLLQGLYEVRGEYQNIVVHYAEILNEPHRSIR